LRGWKPRLLAGKDACRYGGFPRRRILELANGFA
jgi:hypothetical protein